MNNYIVYYYLTEDTTHPYYVGCGTPQRPYQWRKNLSRPPEDRIVIISSGLSKEESYELEEKHISLWGRQSEGGVLINLSSGGKGGNTGCVGGFSGKTHSEEYRNILRQKTGKNNPNYGKVVSEETRQRLSDSISKQTYRLVSPEGEVFYTKGKLNKFCDKHNLNINTLRSFLYNKRKGVMRSGWSISIQENTI